jgi:hypothetical protein
MLWAFIQILSLKRRTSSPGRNNQIGVDPTVSLSLHIESSSIKVSPIGVLKATF